MMFISNQPLYPGSSTSARTKIQLININRLGVGNFGGQNLGRVGKPDTQGIFFLAQYIMFLNDYFGETMYIKKTFSLRLYLLKNLMKDFIAVYFLVVEQ